MFTLKLEHTAVTPLNHMLLHRRLLHTLTTNMDEHTEEDSRVQTSNYQETAERNLTEAVKELNLATVSSVSGMPVSETNDRVTANIFSDVTCPSNIQASSIVNLANITTRVIATQTSSSELVNLPSTNKRRCQVFPQATEECANDISCQSSNYCITCSRCDI